MKITDEKIGDLTSKVNVHIEPEDYRDNVRTVLKDYAKKVQLKGFRKGKVPITVVKKMYGNSVLLDELNKLVNTELSSFLRDNKIPVVGEPIPLMDDIDLNVKEDSSYDFDFEVGLASAFELDYGLVGEFPVYKVSADAETLEKEVKNIQNTYGPMTNPEASSEGDILFGKLIQIDAEGNDVAEGFERMFTLNPERVGDGTLKGKMADGLKPEESSLVVKMEEFTENDNEIRRTWETNVQNEQVRTLTSEEFETVKAATFRFEVRKINRVEPMEIGQELFDKAFGEGTVSSQEEMEAKLSGDMEGFFKREANKFYRVKAIKGLIEGTTIDLPEEFLKRWLVRSRDQITEENIGELFESYARSLRWKLIVDKMQDENPDLVINEDDIRAEAEAQVRQQFGSMLQDEDPERLDAFINYYMQDEKQQSKLFDQALENKVFTYLEMKNPPVTEDITATEFIEKLKSEN